MARFPSWTIPTLLGAAVVGLAYKFGRVAEPKVGDEVDVKLADVPAGPVAPAILLAVPNGATATVTVLVTNVEGGTLIGDVKGFLDAAGNVVRVGIPVGLGPIGFQRTKIVKIRPAK